MRRDEDRRRREDEIRRRPVWPWLLLLILLLAGGGVAAYLLTRPAKRVVPLLIGQGVSTAQTVLQNDGFTPNLIYRNDPKPKDVVIGQSPLSGAKADVNSTVTLTVSSGPSPDTVPSIASQPRDAALRAIRAVGLKPEPVVLQPSATVPAGNAINTDPASGTSLPPGSNVTVFISSGPAPVDVPSVVGSPVTDATTLLRSFNLGVSTIPEPSTTAQPNTVLAQSVTGKAPAGTVVVLTIATTPAQITIPDVTGQTLKKATSTLTKAGFKVSKSTQTTTDKTQNGVVISQSPSAGGKSNQGSLVTLVVGKYKAPPTHTTTTTTPTTTSTTTTPTTPTTPAGP
jgi:serine/threonine-protein kinase